MPQCIAPGCPDQAYAKAACHPHYDQLRLYGEFRSFAGSRAPRPRVLVPAWDRFWPKVDAEGICWEWQGKPNAKGYGNFSLEPGKSIGAHMASWILLVGPIPEGMHMDHLCRNRICVNPDHLEPVSPAVNIQRGAGKFVNGWLNKVKTHCPQGHEYDEANTRVNNGCRQCRTCNRERARAKRVA